jgi:hypothetical protein
MLEQNSPGCNGLWCLNPLLVRSTDPELLAVMNVLLALAGIILCHLYQVQDGTLGCLHTLTIANSVETRAVA